MKLGGWNWKLEARCWVLGAGRWGLWGEGMRGVEETLRWHVGARGGEGGVGGWDGGLGLGTGGGGLGAVCLGAGG